MRLVASLLVLCAATATTIATPAAAQSPLRWDTGLQAGIAQRLTTGGAAGAPTPELGPLVQVQAHVALLPMVRVGLYAAEDLSPLPGRLRSFTAGGLHARIAPPLLPIPWRTWLYAGFGFAAAHDGGSAGTHTDGQLFDVPVGLGLGAKLSRHLMLFTELGARFGLGFYGPMYRRDAGAPTAPAGTGAGMGAGANPSLAPYLGHDAVALALTVGLSWED
ncbi:MAG TPA: hypothetical protein VIY73_06950 [Polyangiaceae bacterium]